MPMERVIVRAFHDEGLSYAQNAYLLSIPSQNTERSVPSIGPNTLMPSTYTNIKRWTYRKVPFIIDPGNPFESRIRAAMREVESHTPIFFSQRTSDANYLRFSYGNTGSVSWCGMQGGEQILNTSNEYTALHEICHALGLIHEQSRVDRDTFVQMNWELIDPDQDRRTRDFGIITNSRDLTAYDTRSIMHYPAPAKGWGGHPSNVEVATMTFKPNPGAPLGPSSWSSLSDLDKAALTILYNEEPGWSVPSQIPWGTKAAFGPRAVANGEVLVMAYKGDGDNGVYWAARSPSTEWSQSVRLDGVGTSAAPAIAFDQGQVFLTWRGVGSDAGIYGTVFMNNMWAPQYKVPNVGTSEAPAMAFWNGQMHLVWKGASDNGLWWAIWNRATAWSPQFRIPGVGTSSCPALAVFEGKLFAAWRGVGTDASLYFAINEGSGWSAQSTVPFAGSEKGPSLAAFNGKLWMTWKGSGDNGVWWASYETATGWSSQARIPVAATSDTPTLAPLGNQLFVLWTGAGSDRSVYSARLPARL
ncbi:MAG: hypothetical protein EOO71_22765 [Myxococcaceae bacterium]|nr:MAG: hypothetical protein EOO71_22765 [Myxococcaceae bacterium]